MSCEHIPFEIIEQILVRCPVKSLLRFMCVSKLWYETIRSDTFNHRMIRMKKINVSSDNHMQLIQQYNKDYSTLKLQQYYKDFPILQDVYKKTTPVPISRDTLLMSNDENNQFQPSTTYEILRRGHNGTYYNVFEDMPDHRWFFLSYVEAFCFTYESYGRSHGTCCANFRLGRSNGIVCLSSYKRVHDNYIKKYIMWNPALRKYVELPYPNVPTSCGFNIGHGFWYDETTNDFKLVRIVETSRLDVMVSVAEIYELKKNTWRVIDKSPSVLPSGVATVWFNGALHWLHGTEGEETGRFIVVIIFDVKDETFKVVEVPSDLRSYKLYLGVLGGHLCIVNYYIFGEIWVMKEYGVAASWSKHYVLNGALSIIGLSKEEERIMVLSRTQRDVKYMEYDPQTHHITVIPHHLLMHYFGYDYCVENLTLLNKE